MANKQNDAAPPHPDGDEYSSSSTESSIANKASKAKKRRRRTRRSRYTDVKVMEKEKAKTTAKPSDAEDKVKNDKSASANQQPSSAPVALGPMPSTLKKGPGVAMLLAEMRQSRGAELLGSPCPSVGGQDLPASDAQGQIAQYAAELQRVSSELAAAQQMLRSNQSEAAVIRTTLESQQSVIQTYQAAEAAEKVVRERNAKMQAEEAQRLAAMEIDDNRPRRKLSRSRTPPSASRSSASSTTTRSTRSFDIDCSPAPLGTARLLEKPPPPVPRRATHVDDNGNFLVPLDKPNQARNRRGGWNTNRGGRSHSNKGRGRGQMGWW